MNSKFTSNTPDNIDTLCIDDVIDFASPVQGLPSPKVRLNYVKMIYQILGYDLSPDIALASIAEPPASLVLSTAGGGKTTWSQIKAIMQKMYRPSRLKPGKKISGDKILCLVYNKHNVEDMKNKHRQLVLRLQSAGIKGLDIDAEINACTLHSFCEYWRKEYVAKLNLVGFTILDDESSQKYMDRAAKIVAKQKALPSDFKYDANKLLQFYVLIKETMKSIGDFEGTDKYEEIGIESDIIQAIFDRYEANKKLHHKYDFVDMLEKFYYLINSDAKVLENIQRYYEYVIADEVQDFTPLMWAILRKLVNNGTPLTAIGDEDQSIYSFRGADIYSTLGFTDDFQGGQIFLLSKNRRCRAKILAEAIDVIQRNSLRFNKKLLGMKDGGEVSYVPYNSMTGQLISVVKQLKKMPEAELCKTVVCYRNTANSMLLVDMLEEANIPFNVLSGYRPFTHELYKHVFSIMDLLEQPFDRALMINLYKVLPCSRTQIYSVFGFNPETHDFATSDPHKHFGQYDYGDAAKIKDFGSVMQHLVDLSNKINTIPVSELFTNIFDLLQKYFWRYKKQMNEDPNDELFEQRVISFFNSQDLYTEFYRKYTKRRGIVNRNIESRTGLTVSTFHSLKGLEFDNVIVICMDNDIFPNFQLIDSHGYSPDYAQQLKEAETRLWYVAITRAKDRLIVYYNSTNPSSYVLDVLNKQKYGVLADSTPTQSIELSSSALEGAESKHQVLQMDSFTFDTGEVSDFADDFDDVEETNFDESVKTESVVAQTFVDTMQLAEPSAEPTVESTAKSDAEPVTPKFSIGNNDYLKRLMDVI